MTLEFYSSSPHKLTVEQKYRINQLWRKSFNCNSEEKLPIDKFEYIFYNKLSDESNYISMFTLICDIYFGEKRYILGNVCTYPSEQKKGYMKKLLNNYIPLFREHNITKIYLFCKKELISFYKHLLKAEEFSLDMNDTNMIIMCANI